MGLMEPAEEEVVAHDCPPEEREELREPWDEGEKRSWVGAKERAWRMSLAALPGGGGGASTQPWKGT